MCKALLHLARSRGCRWHHRRRCSMVYPRSSGRDKNFLCPLRVVAGAPSIAESRAIGLPGASMRPSSTSRLPSPVWSAVQCTYVRTRPTLMRCANTRAGGTVGIAHSDSALCEAIEFHASCRCAGGNRCVHIRPHGSNFGGAGRAKRTQGRTGASLRLSRAWACERACGASEQWDVSSESIARLDAAGLWERRGRRRQNVSWMRTWFICGLRRHREGASGR
ncbi:hypothetical protein GY45DRAFT_556288 [Cubamyces sp. BRFM 1775]|nr:hypothetical protein GY45DRAFT_556288 [Cubamyces sp. BRFM 1775]